MNFLSPLSSYAPNKTQVITQIVTFISSISIHLNILQ